MNNDFYFDKTLYPEYNSYNPLMEGFPEDVVDAIEKIWSGRDYEPDDEEEENEND